MSSFNHCHPDFVVRKQSGCQTRSFTAFGSSRTERAASLAGTHRSWGWAGGQDREWERARSLWGVQEAGAALGWGRREAKEQSWLNAGPCREVPPLWAPSSSSTSSPCALGCLCLHFAGYYSFMSISNKKEHFYLMIHPIYCPCYLPGSLVSLLLPQPVHQAPKMPLPYLKIKSNKTPPKPKHLCNHHSSRHFCCPSTPAFGRAATFSSPMTNMCWMFQFRLEASQVFTALNFHSVSAGFKNVFDYVLTPLLCQSVNFQNCLYVYFIPKGGGNFVSTLYFFLLVQHAASWAVAIVSDPAHICRLTA